MEQFQKILNIGEDATKEQIELQYQTLKKEYTEKMFAEGEEGAKAANFLRELDMAYQDAIFALSDKTATEQGTKYGEVESLIKSGNLEKAQSILDSYEARDCEWHYYQSNLFYKKNWFTDSKKQLEIALQLDPSNQKARNAMESLEKIMQGEKVEQIKVEQQQRGYSENGRYGGPQQQPQMGGGCNCCDCLCAYLLCNSCGGC